MTAVRDDYPELAVIARRYPGGWGVIGNAEATRALDEIDSLRAALALSQDARRTQQ